MNFFNDSIELQYEKTTDLTRRKSLGQFFTPFEIAVYMAGILLKDTRRLKNTIIADPASGLGIFQRAIIALAGREIKFVNYEIDTFLAGQQKRYMHELGADCQVIARDYLAEPWEEKRYDYVISNPPYIKHINFISKKALNNSFNAKLQCDVPITTNYYCYFIFKALYELKERGRAIFIVPGEFLNSNYGIGIKKYLLDEGSIKKIICFGNSERIFRNVFTSPAIILFEKTRSDRIEFITLSVKDNKLIESSPIPHNFLGLAPEEKWKNHFRADPKSFKCLTSFETYARTRRGLATGANDFFLLTEPERISLRIGLRYVRKCIARSCHAKENYWGRKDFRSLKTADKKVWLLYLNDYLPNSDEHIEKYIRHGEHKGFNKKHLPKNRKIWYQMESITIGDIWIGTFSRDQLKFVINGAQISNLTCFHSIILKKPFKKYLYFFMGYFLSSVSKDVLSSSTRELGNGLFKLEPNDLNHSYLPKLDDFTSMEIKEVAAAATEIIKTGDGRKLEKLDSFFRNKIAGF